MTLEMSLYFSSFSFFSSLSLSIYFSCCLIICSYSARVEAHSRSFR